MKQNQAYSLWEIFFISVGIGFFYSFIFVYLIFIH
jgi:hypothetical protein